jgi:hypothetical protein
MNRVIVALREEIRTDETQEKSVVESDSKEKIGNAITQPDLLHRLFINHADYGGVFPRAPGIRDDLLVSWRGWKTHHRRCRGLRKRMWR